MGTICSAFSGLPVTSKAVPICLHKLTFLSDDRSYGFFLLSTWCASCELREVSRVVLKVLHGARDIRGPEGQS